MEHEGSFPLGHFYDLVVLGCCTRCINNAVYGLKHSDGRPETLLDKQAEAIHFLRQHNARLSRKIMELQSLHDSPVRA